MDQWTRSTVSFHFGWHFYSKRENKFSSRFTGRLTFQWSVKLKREGFDKFFGYRRFIKSETIVGSRWVSSSLPPSDVVTRASRRKGRRGRRRRPLVAGAMRPAMPSDVFRCWRKTCKTASRRLTGDLLAHVINGPVTFADVTGVAERKLTTHPPRVPEARLLSRSRPSHRILKPRISPEIKNGALPSGPPSHDFRKRWQFLNFSLDNRTVETKITEFQQSDFSMIQWITINMLMGQNSHSINNLIIKDIYGTLFNSCHGD